MFIILIFIVTFFIVYIIFHSIPNLNKEPTVLQTTFIDTRPLKEKLLEHVNKNIGYSQPICPTCQASLQKMPVRAGTCKQCGNKYFLVEPPYDKLNKGVFDDKIRKVLVNESQLNAIRKEQLNIELMQTSNFFEYEQKYKEEYHKQRPNPRDVFEYKISIERERAATQRNYQTLHRILINHAGFLSRQNKFKEALIELLQAMYMDAHGMPVYHKTNKLLREWTYKIVKKQHPDCNPFNFHNTTYSTALTCIRQLKLSYPQLKQIFLDANFDDLPYKISREFLLPDLQDAYNDLIDILEQKQLHDATQKTFNVYLE